MESLEGWNKGGVFSVCQVFDRMPMPEINRERGGSRVSQGKGKSSRGCERIQYTSKIRLRGERSGG